MYTPLGTLYWRAARRVARRSATYRADPTIWGAIRLREAVRTMNAIAHLYMGGH
jgi:hypothetical protein